MIPASVKVSAVLGCNNWSAPQNNHVLAVGVRSCFAVIKGTSLDMGTITDDHLVMKNGKLTINADFGTCSQEA